ncbi:MAG TPA: DUF3349 domain-containing protein [Streptosporangiaceae bacterium]|jgi:hypothetical protein
MPLASFLGDIVRWLRKGYPEGMPDGDYIPLFALLGQDLNQDEVNAIAAELASGSDARHTATIRAAIQAAGKEHPAESDIARVRGRLAAGGWPLARPDLAAWARRSAD